MQLARWVFWDAQQQTRTILVDAAKDAVRVDGQTLRVDERETLACDALLFPLAIARSSPPEAVRTFEHVVLSFAPSVAADKAIGSEAEAPPLLLHYGELLATWAALCPRVGLALESIEAVEFGRVRVALAPASNAGQADAVTALALLAVALEELCAQRGLVANGMRVDSIVGNEGVGAGHWGVHLAKTVVSAEA